MNSNKLAIVIPYFKLSFFDATLKSLSNQTNKEFNVYIGDDASPEDCSILLEKYKSQFLIKYKRFDSNLGGKSLVKQWERCLELIDAEQWFMILGDDDYLGNDVVEKFYLNAKSYINKSNVIRFSSILVDACNESISIIYNHNQYEQAIDSYCRKLNGESRSSLSEHIFNINSYKKYGFKDYTMAWGSDDRAIIDFSNLMPIYSIDSIVYVRISDLNISGKKDNIQEKIQGRLKCTKDILKDYKSIMNKEQIKTFIALYENLIYRSNKVKLSDICYLLFLSQKHFGFAYTFNQFKSILKKIKD